MKKYDIYVGGNRRSKKDRFFFSVFVCIGIVFLKMNYGRIKVKTNRELLDKILKIIEEVTMKKCRYCGKELDSNLEFCSSECEKQL